MSDLELKNHLKKLELMHGPLHAMKTKNGYEIRETGETIVPENAQQNTIIATVCSVEYPVDLVNVRVPRDVVEIVRTIRKQRRTYAEHVWREAVMLLWEKVKNENK